MTKRRRGAKLGKRSGSRKENQQLGDIRGETAVGMHIPAHFSDLMATPLSGTPISSINEIPIMAKRRRDVVDALPLEIIHDILVHLFVNTLIKFRLVCKPWNSLISNPGFQDDHYHRHQRNRLVIQVEMHDGHHYISTYTKERITSSPKGILNKEEFQLCNVNTFSISDRDCCTRNYRIQSCLGFVCVASWCQDRIFVCNPSTREWLVLPPTSGEFTCIGFGYAASTEEFKVVTFYYSCKTISCNVFTLGTGVWREARSPTFQTLRVCVGAAPFIQGALHLLHCKHNDFSITAFDIETEEYKQIPVPKYYYTDEGILERIGLLSELRGSLCLIGKGRDILELWLLKDYKSGQWVKDYKIDLFLVSRPKDIYRATPLEILGNGSLLVYLYGITWNELICYNPQHKLATQMIQIDGGSWGVFEETIRSLKGKSSK